MLSRASTILLRRSPKVSQTAVKSVSAPMGSRFMSALEDFPSAKSAWEKSCYFEMDFTISEDSAVYEAIQKFSAYDVGCLVTVDVDGETT